jgi:hypothetical protein
MHGKRQFLRWFAAAVLIGACGFAFGAPAQAQRYRSGNFFEQLFGFGKPGGQPYPMGTQSAQPHVDYSRAPPPPKLDTKNAPVVPTTTIVVMGDAMSDWLAYGLEDAFSDSPEIAVVREGKRNSGLLRYEARSDLDWWHVARDILAKQKADYVVMMLGISDRQNIREKDLTTVDDKTPNADQTDKPDDSSAIIAPETPNKKSKGIIEFRSDRWAEIYGRRIDATVAALKSKGVPVFWVGLPAIRGTKSTADAVYLNDLYRARVERAGATYIDVWDGFVDESGKYTTEGPDLEGQVRRLRSWDGVYFTKVGARKLAHYVEREIRHYMANHIVPVALPVGPAGPASEGKTATRPIAGPVLPLTVTTTNTDELVGGAGTQPLHRDAIAASVLVKGDPVPAQSGRADDFSWPRGGVAPAGDVSAAATAPPPPAATPNMKPNSDIKFEIKSQPKAKAQSATKSKTKSSVQSEATAKATPEPAANPKLVPAPEPKPKLVAEEKKPTPPQRIAPQHARPLDPLRPISNLFQNLFGR